MPRQPYAALKTPTQADTDASASPAPWGYHALFDCTSGDMIRTSCGDTIRRFVAELVSRIDMIAYGDIQIAHFATHDPEKAGYSFCQMIETSNITGHFVDKNGNFYIDVFSCKPFDPRAVEALIGQYFLPEEIRIRVVERDA